MAKKRSNGKRKSMTIPLAVVAGFAPLITDTVVVTKAHGITEIPHVLAYHLAGINTWDNNKFSFSVLMKGWTPIIGGFLAHKLASKLGVNRAIAGAGIPLFRI